MRRRQQFIVADDSPAKSPGRRFFSAVGGLIGAAFLLLLSAIGVLLLGWILNKLFPPHTHGSASSPAIAASSVPQDDQAYLNAVGKQVRNSGNDLGALTQLLADATAKPSIVSAPVWQKKATAACSSLAADGNALQKIAPVPDDCAAMNKDVQRAGQRYLEIAGNFAKGADICHLSTSTILRAVKETDIVTQQDDKALVADSNNIRAKYK